MEIKNIVAEMQSPGYPNSLLNFSPNLDKRKSELGLKALTLKLYNNVSCILLKSCKG